MRKVERFDTVKCSLKILGELFGGLGRSGFSPNCRIINPQLCCLRKKSPWIRFGEIFAPFRDFFDEIRTFGDNPVIADCPKSNSQRTGSFQGTMPIRAYSYLDQVIVDKPKVLYSRFKRLGVYKWEDVYRVAGGDVDQEIMAFRFSGTELFNNPIHRDKLQEIWMREKGQKFNILSPVRISNNTFLHLYKMGTQVRCEGG